MSNSVREREREGERERHEKYSLRERTEKERDMRDIVRERRGDRNERWS